MSSSLRRLARQAADRTAAAQERCELCAAAIPPEHRHLLEIEGRQVRCVCYPCSVLFDREAASEGRFRLIPRRRLVLADFSMMDAEWDGLRIPVGMAFITSNGVFYPGPMGATQAFLEQDVWAALCERNPVLRSMQPEVEALLINRVGAAREYYLVPIDDCFRLVGVIRTSWRGLTGGREVWHQIEAFFHTLQGVTRHEQQLARR